MATTNEIGSVPTSRPGWQTTEFWLTIVAALAPLWSTPVLPDDLRVQIQRWLYAASGFVTAVYTISRAAVKVVETKGSVEAQSLKLDAVRFGVLPESSAPAEVPVSHPVATVAKKATPKRKTTK